MTLARESTNARVHKTIWIAGLFWIFATTLYPPWVYTFNGTSKPTVTKPAGHHFLLSSPSIEHDVHPKKFHLHGVTVDLTRLLLQWALFFMIAMAGVVFLRR